MPEAGHSLRGSAVLVVSQHPYPTHRVLRRNVEYIAAQGASVDVVCLRPETRGAAISTVGVRLFRVPLAHRRNSALRYPLEYAVFFVAAFVLVTILSLRRRYRFVEVDTLPDFLVFTALVPRLRGAHVTLFMLELMPEMVATRLGRAPQGLLVRVTRWLEARATGWADRVITVSETCRRVLESRGVRPGKLVVVPGSVALSVTRPLTTVRAADPYLLTMATLIKRYGVDVAVRALARLDHDWPQLRLLVLGEGEQLPELAALAAALGVGDRVRFLGFQPWEVAMDYARGASVGLVPVVADGYGELLLPTKLLEFAALGVPVACARLPAIAEHFPPEAVAYFEPGDADGLAQQVDALLRDPEWSWRQAQAAREAALDLSWERVGPRYLAALDRAA